MSSARGWWIGLGALLLAQVVTPALPVAAQEMAHPHAEGDDGDSPFPEGPLSDTDYATALHLVLGHLDVGEELVAQGAWNDALPHFAHPSEELYPVIGPELARRAAVPFDKELDAFLQRVKAHDAGAGFAEADRALRAKVAAARRDPARHDGRRRLRGRGRGRPRPLRGGGVRGCVRGRSPRRPGRVPGRPRLRHGGEAAGQGS